MTHAYILYITVVNNQVCIEGTLLLRESDSYKIKRIDSFLNVPINK